MARQEDKKKRKNCSLCADKVESIDYKDAAKLKRYLTEAGKIIPAGISGYKFVSAYFFIFIIYLINICYWIN